MPRRVKDDDERIENIIRGLLKQSGNRKCINCNSLGPQYVCTTFWTFVCTNCSGVHREFTHRVKSVSMAKFNEDEIIALQAGGNERAREIYFKAWDPHRNTYPDGSNLNRLREFVKHVYIDRKYAGENKQLPMPKLDSCPNRGRSLDQSSPFKKNGGITFRDLLEERSPQSSKNRHFEIVDDRFREDGSIKRYDHRSSGKDPSRSPISHDVGSLNFEILREKKIKGPPKNTEKKDIDDEATTISQNTTGATILPRLTNQKQNETLDPCSLIEFDDEKAEPDNNPPEIEAPKSTTSSKNNNDSTFPSTHIAPNNPNSLESLLFNSVKPVSSPPTAIFEASSSHLNNASMKKVEILQNDQPMDDSRKNPHLHSLQEDEMSFNPHGDINARQVSNSSPKLKDVKSVRSIPIDQPSEALAQGDGSKASSRKEIPEVVANLYYRGLFTSNFASLPPPNIGWQMHQTYGMGYDMQFRSPEISATALYNASRPENPFDTGDKRFQSQVAMFPSMSPLQEGFSNMAVSAGLVSQPSHCARPMVPHVFSTNMHLGPGGYMVQLPNNIPQPRPQASDFSLTKSEDAFASIDPICLTSGTNSSPTIPNSTLSRTGNPFG
ncbi:Arf-GAP domain and FG repeats-containing protein [Striga asiatica]|uniref:Arf-GAP domain and FG repeats-containing protein n=1 Tax=Striga asiatica TaxID=4170 RepID=A0A5A7Q5F4_STRAF|nr:Arf-GAP domain and FG repeats-containing protein [Striga asiatica]